MPLSALGDFNILVEELSTPKLTALTSAALVVFTSNPFQQLTP